MESLFVSFLCIVAIARVYDLVQEIVLGAVSAE